MLVVLASLLIPVSVISVWAIRTVTNTDQYVATMAPLARNPVIVDHLATKATDELFSTGIVQKKVTAALPAKAKPIVTPIVNEVHSYVYGLALKVFESPKFGQLWDTLNRHTHDAVVDVLTGKQTPLAQKLEKGGRDRRQRHARAQQPHRQGQRARRHAVQPAQADPDQGQQPGPHRRVEGAGLEVHGALQR